jgi:hypothetical protein
MEKKQRSAMAAMVEQAVLAGEQSKAEAKPAKTPRADKSGLKFTIGKDFKPRTDNTGVEGSIGRFSQQSNWEALCYAVECAPEGEITYAEAVAAVLAAGKTGNYEATCNARGFVQGRVRGGHLVQVAE